MPETNRNVGSERLGRLETHVSTLEAQLETLIGITRNSTQPVKPVQDASEVISEKLKRVVDELDDLKRQMVSFSLDDQETVQSTPICKPAPVEIQPRVADSNIKVASYQPSTATPSSTQLSISPQIKQYIDTEIGRQLEVYKTKHFTSLLLETTALLEKRILEKVERQFQEMYAHDSSTSMRDDEHVLPDDISRSKYEADHSSLMSLPSSGRSTPRQNESEEKRVRWELSRSATPNSEDSKETDSEILIQKLREKIEQKARQMKLADNRKAKQDQALKKVKKQAISGPSMSLAQATFSSQLKKKAFI